MEAKQKKLERRRAKQKRKQILKATLAILLALIMVGFAVAPVFSQTTTTMSGKGDPIAFADDFLNDQMNASLDALLVSDATALTLTVGSDTSTDDIDVNIDRMIDFIMANYYQDIDRETLIEGAYKGMYEVLDKHSNYFTQDEYDAFMTNLSGSFSGIGASIAEGENGYIEVIAPIKDTPAEAAGLLPGDLIIAVDGQDTVDWPVDKAVDEIRGEVGTTVTLTIERQGIADPFDVSIVRDNIVIITVDYKMLDDEIGYIQISQFGANTKAEFDEAISYMVNHDVQKLIVDVRNNPGGYLDAVIYVSDYFVENGKTIVKEVLGSGETQTFRASSDAIPADVVVLVNEGSASASEIFAGSIQQTGAGIVIGKTTYGKGTVQIPYDMNFAGAAKITIAEYLLNNDYHVDGKGIIPDVEVSMPSVSDYEAYQGFVPMNEKTTKYYGSIGLNVYGAQERLNLLGEALTLDGVLGYNTKAAIQRFQASNGLSATGNLTVETTKALEEAVSNLFNGAYDPQLNAAIDALK